ncbi:MAG: TadE family protein [Candidatus Limnocylindrales bacterium]
MLDGPGEGAREGGGGEQAGQTLVEFTMVIPLLVIMLMALLEMALALNASLAVNRASQHGAHIAATAGNLVGADCLVLESVDRNLGAPNNVGNVSEVIIERTSLVGNYVDLRQRWQRGGPTDCLMADGSSVKVPYTLVEATYPEADRCTVLHGCPTLPSSPSTVDNIGVTVRYRHDWVTPLNGALTALISGEEVEGGGGGWDFEQRNIFRMEPTL